MMQATGIDAPEMQVVLGGKEWTLRFDNDMIRRTEICYAQAVGVQMGYLGILAQADRGIFGALCAMCYGAIAAQETFERVPARQRVSFAAFDASVRYREMIDAGDDVVSTALRAIDAGRGQQKKNGAVTDDLPWQAMLRAALGIGLTADDFWRMSPAAVLRLVRVEQRRVIRREGSLTECP